jgi:uncharacterized membrane protein (Fun14 family)
MASKAADSPAGANSAAASLRETAKWIAGGIVATAAGVFAGSSLTALGHLSFADDTCLRLVAALVGVVIGFIGLGWLMSQAIGVLTVEGVSLGELAAFQESAASQDKDFKKLADQIYGKYGRFSNVASAKSLSDIITKFDTLTNADEIAAAGRFNDDVIADASFLWVRARFREMICVLPFAVGVAAFGFGLFAWAANPPDPTPAKPAFSLSLTKN